MILQPQVVALGLLLLQTGAAVPTQLNATLGEPFTITCTYWVSGLFPSTIHWSRGQDLPYYDCTNTLTKSNGSWVTYQKESRYQLSGRISQGDVSLTIQNVTMGNRGHYCCRIEVLGLYSVTKKSMYLNVMLARTTSIPTPHVSTAPPAPTHTQNHKTGAVFPNQVNIMVGESVTLPCSYSVRNETVLPMCWGQGPCPSSQCSNTLIKTDGHRVTYQKDSCYWLHGKISQGDVSFIIENVTMGDSGQYCCHIEVLGWFSLIKNIVHLSVMPAMTTRIPPTPHVSTASPTPAGAQSHNTDGNGAVTQSAGGPWHSN